MIETFLEFFTCWGTECGDAGFLADFDFNGDCKINVSDLLGLLAEFATDAKEGMKETFSGRTA